MLDTIRHMELFDPDYFKRPIHIIGAGATGSWLALILAKLGIKGEQITVWDFDKVEAHNIPNQAFDIDQIGESKVGAIRDIIGASTKTIVNTQNNKYEQQRLAGYVFLMVDSMSERKRIWEEAIKRKSAIELLIEPRMGLDMSRLYVVEPSNPAHIEEYEKMFYTDEEAEQSACGASQTVITTAMSTASQCAVQLIKHNNNDTMYNEILTDYFNNNIITTKWGGVDEQ